MIVLCLIVMLSSTPSDSQGVAVDRKGWNKLEGASEATRYAALRNIYSDDQALLEDIAKKDREPTIRAAATARLRNQTLLASLAVKDPVVSVRAEATKMLTDSQLLVRIVTTDPSIDVRLAAIGNATLIDQTQLAALAQVDPAEEVRTAAVQKLTDQTRLALVARTDSHATVAERALSRLKQPATGLLEEIVRTGATFGARMAALERIDDQSVMEKFATDDSIGEK